MKPQFKGGESAMMGFIAKNVKYPQAAIDSTLQGKTIVGFVVRKDGIVSDVHIVKSSGHAVLDKVSTKPHVNFDYEIPPSDGQLVIWR